MWYKSPLFWILIITLIIFIIAIIAYDYYYNIDPTKIPAWVLVLIAISMIVMFLTFIFYAFSSDIIISPVTNCKDWENKLLYSSQELNYQSPQIFQLSP